MLQTFRARLQPAQSGRTLTARAVPFGVQIVHNGRQVQFDAGSITVPDGVIPLTVDHGEGSLERIGKVSRWFEDDTAGFVECDVSETTLGTDVLTLMHDGVLTDVSIGVEVDTDAEFEDDSGVLHRTGVLNHLSVVGKGAFGSAGEGSKIMAVHGEKKEPVMADEKEATAPVVTYDDSEMRAEIVRLNEKLDSFDNKVVKEPELFKDMKSYVMTQFGAAKGKRDAIELLEKSDRYEMEHFISADDTTSAAGFVPNYLSTKILGLLDNARPTVDAFPKIDPGSTGMSVVLPSVTTEAAVAAQANQFDAPQSTDMVIGTSTYALETYAGANRVSVQLVERSSPAFVERLFASLVQSYAQVTDAAMHAALVAGVGTNTAALASWSADAAATYAAVFAGVAEIVADVRRSPDLLIVGIDAWGELMSLLDTEDRPLITATGAPVNAQGSISGNGWNFNYSPGLRGIFDPNAAAGSALIAWSGAAASIETPTPRLEVTNVHTASMDFGLWGLFTDAILYGGNDGGLYSLT